MDVLVVEADIAAGVRVEWLERHPFRAPSSARTCASRHRGPRSPARSIAALAERGKRRFDEHCGECHGRYGADGRVVDYDENGCPDRGRRRPIRRALLAATASFERAANDPALTRGYTRFQRSTGYVPPILDERVGARAYGHARPVALASR